MPDSRSNASRWSIAPCLLVDDVVATAAYYRDTLGFHYERFWGDPPSFCMVQRDGIVIMLSQFERDAPMRPNSVADPEGGPTAAATSTCETATAIVSASGRPSTRRRLAGQGEAHLDASPWGLHLSNGRSWLSTM